VLVSRGTCWGSHRPLGPVTDLVDSAGVSRGRSTSLGIGLGRTEHWVEKALDVTRRDGDEGSQPTLWVSLEVEAVHTLEHQGEPSRVLVMSYGSECSLRTICWRRFDTQ